MKLTIALGVMAAAFATPAFADIVITPDNDALSLAAALLGGTGVTVTGATLDGNGIGDPDMSSGTYTLSGPLPDTYGMTLPGIVLSTGDAALYVTGDSIVLGDTDYGVPASTDQEDILFPITGGLVHFDVTQLDITFDAGATDTLVFQVAFGSEENPLGTVVDGFGLVLNGENLAIVNLEPVNAVHPDMVDAELVAPSPTGTALNSVLAPGDVVVLTIFASVTPGSTGNTLTVILGDEEDGFVDSTVYVAGVPTLPCVGGTNLTANLWKQISIPCDLGAANTVADAFEDDLDGGLGATWWVYAFNGVSYLPLDYTDTLSTGEGYWLRSSTNAAVDVGSLTDNGPIDIPLASQQFDMVGYPFTYPVCWADVVVVDGVTELTLAEADPIIPGGYACDQIPTPPECVMWHVGNRWTGSSYEPFDGITPLLEGQVLPFDGLWVWAGKPGVSLRFPDVPGPVDCSGGPLEGPGWQMRLTARSGHLVDSSAVIAQMPGSAEGFDGRDLREMEPFGSPYLTVVFPHPEWQRGHAGDYATDFRDLGSRTPVRLEVRTSQTSSPVELTWEGPAEVLSQRALVDEATGRVVPMGTTGSYSFDMNGATSRSFLIRLRPGIGSRG